jgi:hypothetical protein
MRDDLHAQAPDDEHAAVIICSDNAACVRQPNHWDAWGGLEPTHKLQDVATSVSEQLLKANPTTSLPQDVFHLSRLLDVLGTETQSWDAPMLTKSDSYWETASRPYEKQLIEALRKTSGEITHADLMKLALKVSNNDGPLALLTLANFTKNMAAIERRQVEPGQITPELRDSYNKADIDLIFNRIAGFADSPDEKYNKEGAIYHFYGSALAGYAVGGPLTRWAVESYADSDRIENYAGIAGANVGQPLADRLLREYVKKHPLDRFSPNPRPLGPHLFGRHP